MNPDPHAISHVRIDASHAVVERAHVATGARAACVASQPLAAGASGGSTDSNDRTDWLTLHAEQLIDRLTLWSDDLTRREANLDVREAEFDRRLRRFRLDQAEARRELDELHAQLVQTERELEIRSEQLQATARRLAIAETR